MAIGASSPFQIPQAGYGFSASQGGFSSNSLNGTSSVFMQGMQMMQLALMGQMMQLMQQLMKMVSGGSAMGSAQFGGGASGSGSPAGFLGSSGSGAGTVASGAKDAGGGWVNPVGGKYTKTSNFGPRKARKAGASTNHQGVDMAGALNTPILAAKAGTVSISKDETTGYGKWIEIKHDDGTRSRYAHMNQRMAEVGARVTAGQQIGKMGSTGMSTGSHLHFEVFNAQGQKVDPGNLMRL